MKVGRRRFLELAAAGMGSAGRALGKERGGKSPRAEEAYRRRVAAAAFERDRERGMQQTNGDAAVGPWAVYSKGLPHRPDGEPETEALQILREALRTGRHDLFESVPLAGYVKLSDPQASFAYDLIGPDAEGPVIAPPPRFSSAEQAWEMVEMYWHALLRDVPFDDYETNALAQRAAEELSRLEGHSGVRPTTLFRGRSAGSRDGPYVSQFLWRDLPWTPIRVPQRIRTAEPGVDYLTDRASWLNVQNGAIAEDTRFAGKTTYIRTGRDLAEYVHRDFTYQAFLGALLMLFKMSAPLDGAVPYSYSISQSGFVTFGASDAFHLVAVVANVALKASWFQKWRVHMRLRPEEYAGRVESYLTLKKNYPLHAALLDSAALTMTRSRGGTALLPHSYPEGAPTHPSYPAGHAVIAGACATVLKAFFNENFVIPQAVTPAADGQTLKPYKGAELKVGPELDKLAENVALGRDWAGIHWRSDGAEGLRLGEAVALNILREMRMTSHEVFGGFDLTTFDGKRVTVQ